MNNNLIVISYYNNKRVLMHIVNDKVYEIYAYDDEADDFCLGTIVNARVEKQLDGMDASFVRFGDRRGYLNKAYKCETVVPVMYKKEPVDNKKGLYTEKLSITGIFAVVFADDFRTVRCSSKISSNKSSELKQYFSDIANELNVSILLRTRAADDIEGTEDEIRKIAESINYIRENSKHRTDGSILFRPLPLIISDCEEMINRGATEIVTDIKGVYEQLLTDYSAYFGRKPVSERAGLRLYEDEYLPLNKLYAFESKMRKALGRLVHLKNKATITFDKTEALYAIDVNSASYLSKNKSREDLILNVNIEAAREICRQIVIRNISGIIIIDFINMNNSESYDILAGELRSLMGNDSVKCEFCGFTKLGLAEVCRQKKRASLFDLMR